MVGFIRPLVGRFSLAVDVTGLGCGIATGSLQDFIDLLQRQVIHRPRQNPDLLTHIVDIILGTHLISRQAIKSDQSITDDGIACPADMEWAVRISRGMFNQDLGSTRRQTTNRLPTGCGLCHPRGCGAQIQIATYRRGRIQTSGHIWIPRLPFIEGISQFLGDRIRRLSGDFSEWETG